MVITATDCLIREGKTVEIDSSSVEIEGTDIVWKVTSESGDFNIRYHFPKTPLPELKQIKSWLLGLGYEKILKTLTCAFPNTNPERLEEVATTFEKYKDIAGINTSLRIAHFFAQTRHESSNLTKPGGEGYCFSQSNAADMDNFQKKYMENKCNSFGLLQLYT